MLDSFRQDHVSFYNRGTPVFSGIEACRTPNIDSFAEECIVFSNAYPCGLPTIPVRTELLTGQYTLHNRPWQPLSEEDITLAEILGPYGYTSCLVSDCYHYRAPGMNFHRGFSTYQWVRGQEYDPSTAHLPSKNINDYVNENFDEIWRGRIGQFLSNTEDFKKEEDWFAASVVAKTVEWLRKNRNRKKIFVWMDSFEPHEPWDPPEKFDTYSDPQYKGKRLIMPMGGFYRDWATEEEAQYIRGLYAGEASFVDYCLGSLFDNLKDLGYYEDSIIVLTADHGHPLGDHGKFLKGTDRMYSELLKVPFMIRMPGGKGARKSDALVQFPDLLPTLLDAAGADSNNQAMHGKSFLRVLKGETDRHRMHIISGYHESEERCIRDEKWSYIRRPENEKDELYNLTEDPRETANLIEKFPGEAARLSSCYGSIFWHGAAGAQAKGIQGKYELASGDID